MADTPHGLTEEHTPIWWNIVFLPREARNWWDYLSPKGCRHVLAFGYVPPSDRWLVIDPQEGRTIVASMTSTQFDAHMEHWLAQDPYILRIKAGEGSTYSNRFVQSCSSIVARAIGLGRGAWRPALLMRRLRDLNAEIRRIPNVD